MVGPRRWNEDGEVKVTLRSRRAASVRTVNEDAKRIGLQGAQPLDEPVHNVGGEVLEQHLARLKHNACGPTLRRIENDRVASGDPKEAASPSLVPRLLMPHNPHVRADPDQMDAQVSWFNGPVASKLYGLVWLAFAVAVAGSSTASTGTLVAMGALGLGVGLALARFDKWWGQRPSVRLIDTRPYTEIRRFLLPIALAFITLLIASRLAPADTSAVFTLCLLAVLSAFVSPRSYRRRAARRQLKLLAIETGE